MQVISHLAHQRQSIKTYSRLAQLRKSKINKTLSFQVFFVNSMNSRGAPISSLSVWRAINSWYAGNDKTDHQISVFSWYLPSTRLVQQSIHQLTCQVRCMTSQSAEFYTNSITWCSEIGILYNLNIYTYFDSFLSKFIRWHSITIHNSIICCRRTTG